jgi:acyl-coenzyme A thioesterase PaaI-like protein
VNLVKTITVETGPVRATGRVISATRRIIVAEARLTASNGDLLAFGTSTLMLTPPPSE